MLPITGGGSTEHEWVATAGATTSRSQCEELSDFSTENEREPAKLRPMSWRSVCQRREESASDQRAPGGSGLDVAETVAVAPARSARSMRTAWARSCAVTCFFTSCPMPVRAPGASEKEKS